MNKGVLNDFKGIKILLVIVRIKILIISICVNF